MAPEVILADDVGPKRRTSSRVEKGKWSFSVFPDR